NFAVTVFKQDDSHALIDVIASDVTENACPLVVQGKVHRWLLRLLITSGLRILQVFPGKNNLTSQEQWVAIAVFIALEPKRNFTGTQGRFCCSGVVYHANF